MPRAAQPGAALRARVLLVEDHPELAAYLGERLAELFPVRVVADAEAALRDMEQHQIRLLISDVKLPGMDGIELCRQVRAQPRFAQLPVMRAGMILARSLRNEPRVLVSL